MDFHPFASPWWANLLILVPGIIYIGLKQRGVTVSYRSLVFAALAAAGFGIVDACVVFYLRTIAGILPGQGQAQIVGQLSQTVLTVEKLRETAIIIMFIAVASLGAKKFRDKVVIFFWCTAFWDIFFYAGLYTIVQWPTSLLDPDIIMAIPVPWYSQVWYPLLLSCLFIIAVILLMRRAHKERAE